MEELSEKVSSLALKDSGEGEERKRRTGVVYDARMRAHKCESDPSHPETPDRITEIWQALQESGLTGRCVRVEARNATKAEIETIHSEAHFNMMQGTVDKETGDLWRMAFRYNSIYLNKATFPCALLSAGSVVEMTERVVRGELTNGMAIVRPPGHHAESTCCMGFCIFNNVAIAAKIALDKHSLKRILIVDWDVHHGNATQNQFYNDKRVLYFSLHRYDNGQFYPGRREANYSYVGGEGAEGYNVNVAWNTSRMGDAEYLAAFHHILLPIAYEFDPELVLISCGFDAALGDPLGRYCITPAGYAHMTHLLSGLAGGRVVIALEGGYNLTSISNSMCGCAGVLLGDPLPQLAGDMIPNSDGVECIKSTLSAQAPFWKSLRMFGDQAPDQPLNDQLGGKPGDQSCDQSHSQSGDQSRDQSGGQSGDQSRDQSGGEAGGDHVQSGDQAVGGAVGGEGSADTRETQDHAVDQMGAFGQVMFAVSPLSFCDHLSTVSADPLPPDIASAKCEVCSEEREPWVCLACHHVYCGRYINQHMLSHHYETSHTMAVSLADISAWCFACDSYVDHRSLRPAKNAVHRSKFGHDIAGPAD